MSKRKIGEAHTIFVTKESESEPENKKIKEEANTNTFNTTLLNTGMTNNHTLELTKFFSSNEMISIWRPINEHAATKLDDTHRLYKGKGLNVKGKSSEFGPIAGEIPLNVALSKMATTQPDKIPDYQAINDACLKKEQSEYEELKSTINSDNINEINEKQFLTTVLKKDDQKHEELKSPEKEQVEEFKIKVAKLLAEQEIQNRAEKINQLINELDKMIIDYRKDYKGPSLIEKALRGLNKLKSETKTVQLSTTKTISREK